MNRRKWDWKYDWACANLTARQVMLAENRTAITPRAQLEAERDALVLKVAHLESESALRWGFRAVWRNTLVLAVVVLVIVFIVRLVI